MGITGYIKRKLLDGGKTWAVLSTVSADFRSVFFTDKNNGYAGGDNGTFETTSDGGKTWKLVIAILYQHLFHVCNEYIH